MFLFLNFQIITEKNDFSLRFEKLFISSLALSKYFLGDRQNYGRIYDKYFYKSDKLLVIVVRHYDLFISYDKIRYFLHSNFSQTCCDYPRKNANRLEKNNYILLGQYFY